MSVTFLITAVLTASPTEISSIDSDQLEPVQRAAAFLKDDNLRLVSGNSCVNCHHGPIRGWSLREAARISSAFNANNLEATTDGQLNFLQERAKSYGGKKWGHSLAMFYAVSLAETSDRLDDSLKEQLTEIILDQQTEQGTWRAANQFNNQRRPKGEGQEVQTMWGVLALSKLSSNDEVSEAKTKALSWLTTAKRGTTIDSRVLRLLLAVRGETSTSERSDELLSELQGDQHDDGGWGWQKEDESDAWGTGLALYALSQLELTGRSDAVTKGRAFLMATQKKNGSWHVEGKLKKNPEMASYFGTAWAVIGLARTRQFSRDISAETASR